VVMLCDNTKRRLHGTWPQVSQRWGAAVGLLESAAAAPHHHLHLPDLRKDGKSIKDPMCEKDAHTRLYLVHGRRRPRNQK
jgi:hypothetical protein